MLVSIALLGSWGMQKVADACFYFAHNAEQVTHDLLTAANNIVGGDSSGEASIEAEGKEAYVLYYSAYSPEEKATRYIYTVYYLTGSEGARGLESPSGEQLLEERYDNIYLLPQAFLLEEDGVYRFYDQELKLLSDQAWDEAEPAYREDGMIDCDLIKVGRNGLYGAVNLQGQIVIEPQYDQFDLYTFETDWHVNRVKKDGKYGYIDQNGNIVVSLNYDFAMISTVKAYREGEDPSDPDAGYDRPVVYVLSGDRWGMMYKLDDGGTGDVTWGVEPPAEMVEAADSEVMK